MLCPSNSWEMRYVHSVNDDTRGKGTDRVSGGDNNVACKRLVIFVVTSTSTHTKNVENNYMVDR